MPILPTISTTTTAIGTAVPVTPPVPKKFGPSIQANYPSEMRTQLWPLCCGARILSGFKLVHTLSDEQLLEKINETLNDWVPDLQVFSTENMRPVLTFLTLNAIQMGSPKIMGAVEKAGFVKFAEAKPRGSPQGFFVQDKSKTFETA